MGAGLLGLILLARAPEGFDQTEAYSPWTLAQPTENYETRDAYLRGMKLREKSNGFALSLAADQFQQAIDGDAEFAPAYAALAAVDAAIFQNEPGANVALIAKTDRLIAQAKALSPKSPQVRLAEGEIAAFRGDYVGALSMASTLIEENPHFLAAYLLKGAALMELGRIDAARDTMDIAISLDPLSPEVLHIVSEAKYMTGDFDGAREAAKANLWWNPESTKSLLSMAHIERERGHYERAFDYLQRARHLNSLDSVVIYDLIELYSDLGLSQARAEVAQGHVQRSLVYAMIGNRDETDAALIQLDLRDVHVNIHYYLRDYETAAQRFDIFLSSRPDARIKPGDGLQYARMCLAYNRARQPQSDRICGLLAAYYTDKMPEDLHLRKDILGGAAYFLQSGDLPRALLWLDHLAVAGHSFSDLTTDPLFATLETTPDYAPIAAKMETTAQIQRRFIQRKLGD